MYRWQPDGDKDKKEKEQKQKRRNAVAEGLRGPRWLELAAAMGMAERTPRLPRR